MTLKELADTYRPFHNHIGILYDAFLVRILGVGQDDDDLYYICSDHSRTAGFEVRRSGATGSLYSLKGLIPNDRYIMTDSIFALNGCPHTPNFQVVEPVGATQLLGASIREGIKNLIK